MFNFFIEYSSSSGSLFWSPIFSWIGGVITAFAGSFLAFFLNRCSSKQDRVFNAKKDAYDAALSFVNEAQARKGVIDEARVAIIGAKLELCAAPEILDAYKQLEKEWNKRIEESNPPNLDELTDEEFNSCFGKLGTGMATKADIEAFIDLLRKDLGIKVFQS